jgi:YihY family inner membrane protein
VDSFPVVGREISSGSLKGSGGALVVGIALAVWAGLRVIQGMQDAMNRVWNVPMQRRPGFVERLGRNLLMLVLLGVATIGATALSGAGAAASGIARAGGIAVALLVNAGLFFFGFRVLTEEPLSWREVLPGALLAGVLWTLLQVLGSLYVDHQIRGASETYGTFAAVIGLLSWLYLGAQVSLMAAEVNAVRARRLWPRSLVQPPLTDADRSAMEAAIHEAERRPEQRVTVRYEDRRDPRPERPHSG